MWVFTRARSELDVRYLLNLDKSSRVGLAQLGDRWFVEAEEIVRAIFENLRAGVRAVDLATLSLSPIEPSGDGGAPGSLVETDADEPCA